MLSKVSRSLIARRCCIIVLILVALTHIPSNAQTSIPCLHNSYGETIPYSGEMLHDSTHHWYVTYFYRLCTIEGCSGRQYMHSVNHQPSRHRSNAIVVRENCANGLHTFFTRCKDIHCNAVYPYATIPCSGPPHSIAPFSQPHNTK